MAYDWRFAREGDMVVSVPHEDENGTSWIWNVGIPLKLMSEPYLKDGIEMVDVRYGGRQRVGICALAPTKEAALAWAKREIAELKQRISELDGSHA